MKNAFILIQSFFGISYAAAAAAHAIGMLPFSVLNLPVFIGGYTAAGVLAIAVSDYTRHSRLRPRRSRQPDAGAQQAARPVPCRAAVTWAYNPLNTLSA